MSHAIINAGGQIMQVALRLQPTHKVPPGGRIVRHAPPPHDPETQTCTAVEPVPSGQAAVQFLIQDKPDALETLRARKLREIDGAFSAAAEALLQGYPQAERLTWPIQQTEALGWAANNDNPTPYLDGLAAARGIAAEDMRARTLDAVQAWMGASQVLIGKRQALRDAAHLAQTKEGLAALVWPVTN
ncbi:hypothetical protein ACLBKS_02145 [Hylemonella sp. W303a]|uniref:hypothetical protein n=1 Tax=Hylemonella sp. W303a TaxID=3389873 RepID=UPI00396B0267